MPIWKNVTKRFGKTEQQFLLLGLRDAGKRTTLAAMNWGPITTSRVSRQLTLTMFDYKQSRWIAGDVGDPRAMVQWRAYYPDTTGLIFVIDAADHERIEDARRLMRYVADDAALRDVPMLVLANKQDLPTAMSPGELTERSGLNYIQDRPWHLQPTAALQGNGISQGLDWLSKAIR